MALADPALLQCSGGSLGLSHSRGWGGTFPAAYRISLLPVFKSSPHTLTLNFLSAGILLAVHSVLRRIGWVSQLGARASGFSSYLYHHVLERLKVDF